MGVYDAVVLSPVLAKYYYSYVHWCAGCHDFHVIAVDKKNLSGADWTFNHNVEKPTFHPSINDMGKGCHYWIRDGMIEYCADSKHTLAGQTLPLEPLPNLKTMEGGLPTGSSFTLI